MTVTQNKIIPGTSVIREVGGNAGTHEVQIYHDGVNGTMLSKLGNLSLQPTSGNTLLNVSKFPSSDGTSGQYLYTDGVGNLNWAGYGSGLSFSAGTLSFRQGTALSVVGNATNATANITDIVATANSNQVLMVSAAGTTLTWNTLQSANIAASAVTYAKIQNESANTLLGNPTTSAAVPSEIIMGSGLTFTSGTLNASSGSGSSGTSVMHFSFFTAAGTFNTPAATTTSTVFKFTLTGGGGGGGNGSTTGAFTGGGGGAAATVIYYATGLSGSNAIVLTIGAGGAGGTSSAGTASGAANNGTTGGSSTFTWNGTAITAGAGSGGTSGSGTAALPGKSGVGTGSGAILLGAGDGFPSANNNNSTTGETGGMGGASIWGGGGNMGKTSASTANGGSGTAGSAYGSGGGGASSSPSTAAGSRFTNAGGSGGGGCCLVEWVL